MTLSVGYSKNPELDSALAEIRSQWGSVQPRLILSFASPTFDAEALARKMRALYPGVEQLGCTTAGELVTGQMLKGAVVAMALPDTVLESVKVELISNLDSPQAGVDAALARLAQHTGKPIRDLDPRRYVGLVLVDGLSRGEERLMDAIGNATDVLFLGGSAGDELKFEHTRVTANGRAQSGAAALALLEVRVPFRVMKTQSFRRLPKEFVATKVDEAERRVYEFDQRPAVEAYAAAVGTTPARINEHFMRHPVGLMVDDEPFVRSPMRAEMGSLKFYCNIKEGMRLALLESTDIVKDTAEALRAQERELGSISGVINFHCILRTLELFEKGQTEAYGQVFANVPMIGFSTYGEQYVGHMNQTSTMLVFGR